MSGTTYRRLWLRSHHHIWRWIFQFLRSLLFERARIFRNQLLTSCRLGLGTLTGDIWHFLSASRPSTLGRLFRFGHQSTVEWFLSHLMVLAFLRRGGHRNRCEAGFLRDCTSHFRFIGSPMFWFHLFCARHWLCFVHAPVIGGVILLSVKRRLVLRVLIRNCKIGLLEQILCRCTVWLGLCASLTYV